MCSGRQNNGPPKDVPVPNPRTQNIAKGTLHVIKLMILRWQMILNYPVGNHCGP